MDDVSKCRIRLNHWLEHNADHLQGYREVAGTLEGLGFSKAAVELKRAIGLIEEADNAFRQAVASLPAGHENTASDPPGHHGHKH